jgi:phosphatidylserine decarboxylase
VPMFLRSIFYGSFGLVYGVKMHEAENPNYSSYRTFTDFFTRTLTTSARKIN